MTDAEKRAKEINDNIDSLKTSIEEKATVEALEALKTSITKLAEKGSTKEELEAEFTKLNDILEAQAAKIVELGRTKGTKKLDIVKTVTDSMPNIEKVFKAGAGNVKLFEQKAVALVTTANVTTNVFGSQALINTELADESNANDFLRATWIDQYASVSSIDRAFYSYVDWNPLLGDAAVVAEGGAKPQLDLQSVATQVSPSKIAAYIALTEESVTDITEMSSVASYLLRKKVELKRQSTILTYLTGTVASAYTAGTALAATVPNPNLSDVVQAMATQVFVTENYTDDIQMMPNVAFVNPIDYFEMNRSKDANDNYVYPQFAGLGANVTIIPNPYIAAGYVLVADMTKLNIKNYIDYSVRLGWINAQFIENEFTMVGETRYFAFVKTLDQKAFLYNTIQSVITDITKP